MSNPLLKYVPLYMRKNKIYIEIFNAQNNQLETISADIVDINNQLFIDSATWALDLYEKEFGIQTVQGKPLEERRSVIKSKMRGHGTVDAALIKLVVDSFTNGDVEVTFDGNINIEFTSIYGVPENLQDAKDAVEDITPAHLPLVYVFRYFLYSNVLSSFETYGDLKSENVTYSDLLNNGGGI